MKQWVEKGYEIKLKNTSYKIEDNNKKRVTMTVEIIKNRMFPITFFSDLVQL